MRLNFRLQLSSTTKGVGCFLHIASLADQILVGQKFHRMLLLIKPKLLILDEMGYLALDSFAATSNKSYGDWGSIFADNEQLTAETDN